MTFLRVRTKKHEIMIAPGMNQSNVCYNEKDKDCNFYFSLVIDHDYLLIVVQNPTEVMQQ